MTAVKGLVGDFRGEEFAFGDIDRVGDRLGDELSETLDLNSYYFYRSAMLCLFLAIYSDFRLLSDL